MLRTHNIRDKPIAIVKAEIAMLQLDTQIFLLFNAGPAPDAVVAGMAIYVTKYLVLLIPPGILCLWIVSGNRNRQTAIALVLALLIAIIASYLIGQFASRPRPFMIDLGSALIEHRPNSSFPSNHGLVFATCAALLFLIRRSKIAWAATVAGIAVAWSRIYVGVHYPSDMLGSLVIAVLSALAALWIMARHGARLLSLAEQAQAAVLRLISIR